MASVTFQHGALRVSVRSSIGMDELDSHVIAARLRPDNEQVINYRAARISDIILQSNVLAGIEQIAPLEADGTVMAWPTASSSADALRAWQLAILNQPRVLMRKWLAALAEADMAPGEDVEVQGAQASDSPKDGPPPARPTPD